MAFLRPNAPHGTFAVLLVALVLALAPSPAGLAADSPRPALREPEVKAAALCNIIVFTDWPAAAFPRPDTPLVVGVLGRGPVADVLASFLENETWHGRPLVLQRYATAAQVKVCHVLYVAESEHARWPALRRQLAGRPVLTVGDATDFAQQGGVVQFGLERNKLTLTVNLGAARAGDLTISSKVLRLAQVVGDLKP